MTQQKNTQLLRQDTEQAQQIEGSTRTGLTLQYVNVRHATEHHTRYTHDIYNSRYTESHAIDGIQKVMLIMYVTDEIIRCMNLVMNYS